VPDIGVALDEPSVVAMQGNAVIAAGQVTARSSALPESLGVLRPLQIFRVSDEQTAFSTE
jgi:hypothetical protein